jgi:hypothetical protein
MRRSKSNPAKYARNYRSISQRRMTEQNDNDDDKYVDQEMKRLQQVMRTSEDHLREGTADANANADETPKPDNKKNDKDDKDKDDKDKDGSRRKRGRGSQESSSSSPNKDNKDDVNDVSNLLSEEMQQEWGDTENPILLTSRKKKKKKKAVVVQLTAQEIKQAKQLQKNTARKMKQLQDRAAQKTKRSELYNSLTKTAISKEQMQLLESSSTLGKRVSKREQLKKILHRERAGLTLTADERDLLYKDRGVVDNDEEHNPMMAGVETPAIGSVSVKDNTQSQAVASPENKKRKETPTQKGGNDSDESKGESDESSSDATMQDSKAPASAPTEAKPTSLAAQMMASLSTLKTDSAVQAEINAKERQEAAERKRLLEDQEQESTERYVPTNPAILKTAATLGLKAEATESQQKVKEITRPGDVKASRYHLPVASMEFEVMDGIRNNDVTIICGETGSGTYFTWFDV